MISDVPHHAAELVYSLDRAGFRSRLFGSVAVILLATKTVELCQSVKDIDLVSDSKDHRLAWSHLQKMGWQPNKREVFLGNDRRLTLWNKKLSMRLDLYSDPLVFNHNIELGERLALWNPTLTPADLLLTKLQIVDFTKGDLNDTLVLLETFEVCSERDDGINIQRVTDVCRRDWGLYFTCTQNIAKIASFLSRTHGPTDGVNQASNRLQKIRDSLLAIPKTMRWKLRSFVGPRIRWYNLPE